jgi:hypothetical protein
MSIVRFVVRVSHTSRFPRWPAQGESWVRQVGQHPNASSPGAPSWRRVQPAKTTIPASFRRVI